MNLLPEKHINRIVGETYNLVRNIKVAFRYLDEEMIKKLIVTMIRPKLEYAAIIWSPCTKMNIKKIERIQRSATKLVPSLQNLSHKKRLKRLNLQTMEQRRERDLIAVYRLMNGMEKVDNQDLVTWDKRDTRGYGKKIKKATCRMNIKKYSFPYRIVETWNSLERDVVNARSIHDLRDKLDNSRYRDGTIRV